MSKDALTIKQELAKPFAPEDLEWRPQQTNREKTCGMAVAYVTNRAIQDRLDDVVGPDNWHNDFRPWHPVGNKESQICGISIYNEERKEWNTKWDGAEDTDIEAVKGGLSDSMKRAAVQWGIGRYLYKMDGIWVNVEVRGKSCVILQGERAKLDEAYLAWLKKLNLTPAQPGGLQSELTPKAAPAANSELSQQSGNRKDAAEKPAKAHEAGAASPSQPPPTNTGKKIAQLPSVKETVCDYTVVSAKTQTGMKQNTVTNLILRDQDGKTKPAFYRGVDKGLVSGAELTKVKLSLKQQNTVVFYVLENYEIMNTQPQAA